MALEYFLYNESYNNTLVDRSKTTFAPTPPGFDQILIDYFVPPTQPLYYYREDAGLIVLNDEATINAYLEGTYTGVTSPTDSVLQYEFTGYTATTRPDIDNKVFRSGDTMTGSLNTSGNLTAIGAVTGSSVSASVLITTPILNASTSISAPLITGTTCVTSPITCATARVQAPVVCGGTCVTSPITCATSLMRAPTVCGGTYVCSPAICGGGYVNSPVLSGVTTYAGSCLCSQGTSALSGAVSAASTLNVSGDTTLGAELNVSGDTTLDAQMYMNGVSTGGTLSDYSVVWNPITKQIRTLSNTGGTACVYCYADNRVIGNNNTQVNTTYLTRTWILPSGYYEYEYNATYGNNTTNRCAIVCFLMNGSVVGYCNLMKTNDTNVIATAYVTQNNQLTGGVYQPSIVYRQCGGGTTSVYFGSIRVQKIGETA